MSYTGVPYAGNNGAVNNPDLKDDVGYSGMPRRISKGSSSFSSSLNLLKALLLPTLAIAYLTFCYIVHYHTIPINMHGIINVSPQNIASIKAGVTSISILIIALGLWPLRDLIQDLRSKEFFRVISARPSGVPISVANSISNPAFSTTNSLKVQQTLPLFGCSLKALGNIPNGMIQFAFLHCLPHPMIATREIRSDGKGTLTVQPDDGRSLRRQGNLEPSQVGMLLSAAFTDFQDNVGPQYSISGLGTQAQVEFIFGKNQVASVSQTTPTDGLAPITTLAPQSLSDITAVYTTMAQAAAKVYMTGTLGTAYVPGRIGTSEVVFDSSLPHVIVSTFLFVVLSLLVVIAHFRSGKEGKFTLFGVAAALHRSVYLPNLLR